MKIMEKVLPMANAISNNQFLVSLRDGFMVAFPATMFASIAMIIQNFPQTFRFDGLLPQAVLDFLNNFFGPVGNATMNVSSVFVVFGIAYTLGKKLKCNPLYAGAIALASFFMLLPFQVVKDVTYMPLPKLGAQGMFVGILTAFIATEIFAFLENKDITIKMPEQIPQGIANSFTSILPGAVTLMVFNIIRYIFTFTKWGECFHRYILGVYALYEKIINKYPEILIEGCAAGGGRFDPGILYYSPQIWTSDNTDAMERMKIQFGTSLAYPIHTLSNHISEVPNAQVKRNTSIKTRGNVAFFGNFGYEMDLVRANKEELASYMEQIKEYKRIRHMILNAHFYHIQSPFDGNETIWALVTRDRKEVMIGYYQILAQPNATTCEYIKLPFLDENSYYEEKETGMFYNGSLLKEKGIRKPSQFNGANESTAQLFGDYQSKIIYLTKRL